LHPGSNGESVAINEKSPKHTIYAEMLFIQICGS
jgi:hypothetical protein